MPVVPITSADRAKRPSREPPAEPFALMAAAQMHSEGRLVENPNERPSEVPQDNR